jgi:nickel/cobalt transporter (NicO) family protein
MIRKTTLIILLLGLCWLTSDSADAHPLGNFSVNQYAFLEIEQERLVVNYYIDFAEIPTVGELSYLDLDGNKEITEQEKLSYLNVRQKEFLQNLTLDIGDVPCNFILTRRSIQLPDPLSPTLIVSASLEVDFRGVKTSNTNQAHFEDRNFPTKSGWKDIQVTPGAGVAIAENSIIERRKGLNLFNTPPKDYMNDTDIYFSFTIDNPVEYTADWRPELSPPVTLLEADIVYEPTTIDPLTGSAIVDPSAAIVESRPQKHKTSKWSDKLIELIKEPELSGRFIWFALMLAFAFGAAHALEPGHGKTVVAAYLIGERGTIKDAVMLGLIVTATHTASVFLMWACIMGFKEIFPEQVVFKFTEIFSGFLIVGLGVWLLFYRWYNPVGHTKTVPAAAAEHSHHEHEHEHKHGKVSLMHTHGPGGHTHEYDPSVSYKQLFVLGITGGIIPCPGAIIVLLVAMNRQLLLFGFSLIMAFSVGLAIVLVAIGIMMVTAKGFFDRMNIGGGMFTRRILPVASALAVIVLGLFLTLEPLSRYGYIEFHF